MNKKTIIHCSTCDSIANSVFCALKGDELLRVNAEKSAFTYKKGHVIFSESNRPYGMFCVYKGKVKIYKISTDGKEQIIRLAKDADILGYRSFLANEPYQAFAETLEESTICFIPGHVILELLQKNINLSLKLMEHMAKDLKQAEQKSIDLMSKTARERLCEALALLSKSFGTDDDGYLNIKLSREDIANITGMAVETVVRNLKDLEEDGLVVLEKRRISIPNLRHLMTEAKMED